jgi:hypothetical protein
MGKGARACQGDCGAAPPLQKGVMAKDKDKLDDDREQRLAAALRANLKRRKEQARGVRDTGQSDERAPE